MKGSIYLIGGGEIRKGETVEIDNELREIVPETSTFVFFATAAGDSSDYIHTIKSVFGDKLHVIAPTEADGPEFAISAIQSASIIYLGGGTTQLLVDLFVKWGLVQHLERARERGVHLVGMSAGALALSTWYIDENENNMELRQGWGLVPACVLVHAKQDSSTRAENIWKDSKEAYSNLFLAIGEGAAWRINTTDAQKIGNGDIWKSPNEQTITDEDVSLEN